MLWRLRGSWSLRCGNVLNVLARKASCGKLIGNDLDYQRTKLIICTRSATCVFVERFWVALFCDSLCGATYSDPAMPVFVFGLVGYSMQEEHGKRSANEGAKGINRLSLHGGRVTHPHRSHWAPKRPRTLRTIRGAGCCLGTTRPVKRSQIECPKQEGRPCAVLRSGAPAAARFSPTSDSPALSATRPYRAYE